jgi:hypothetical protein
MRRTRRLLPPLAALLLAAFAAFPDRAEAIEFEIGALGGVQQTGDLASREGTIELDAGALYGVVAGWRVKPDGIVEIAWTRQATEASGDLTTGAVRFDAVVDTLEFGGLWETRPGAMRPFLGLSLGGTRLADDGEGLGEGWNASGAISGGVRWFFGEHALLRLEGRATGIYFAEGGALACTFPLGVCGVSASGDLLGAFSARVALSARF